MGNHFVEKCRGCGKQLSTCRCPAQDKPVRWGQCGKFPNCYPHDKQRFVKDVFSVEFRNELMEKTTECDQLRAEVERLKAELKAGFKAFDAGLDGHINQLRELREAAEAFRAVASRYIGHTGCELDSIWDAEEALRAVLAKTGGT
jgi:hypothetical protein